ncbi:MAG: hypothetical protein ACKPKO_26520, partial [Candidatus Fonsibacter sp.]
VLDQPTVAFIELYGDRLRIPEGFTIRMASDKHHCKYASVIFDEAVCTTPDEHAATTSHAA